MPTVPTLDRQQVSLQPLQAPTLSTQAPIEAFGGGGALAGNKALGQLNKLATEIALDEKKKSDDIVMTDATSRALSAKNRLLWEKDTGALNKLGKDSFSVIDDYTPQLDSELDDIEKELSNDQQRQMFQRIRVQSKTDFNDQLTKHIFKESRAFDETATKAALKSSQDEAVLYYGDPGKIKESIAGIENLIDAHGDRNGLPQKEIDNMKSEAISATHKGVIHRMLSNGDDRQASRYFKDNKNGISGSDVAVLEKSLEEGSFRGEAQRRTALIMETAKSEPKALARARAIADTKVQDEVVRRVKIQFNERAVFQKENNNKLFMQSLNLIDANPDKDVRDLVAPDIWEQLSSDQRKDLLKFRSENFENDGQAWLDFLDLNQQSLASLNQSDFQTKYWTKFDSSHRSRAESMWRDARKSQSQGLQNPKITAIKNFNTRVLDNLRSHGIIKRDETKKDLNEDELNRYLRFEEEAQSKLTQFELNELGGKRKASPGEQQQVLDDLLKQKIMISDWGFDSEKFITEVQADEQGDAYVDIDNIPQKERNAISNLIVSKGKRVTEDKLERAYAAYLLGNRALLDSIVAE